MRMDEAKQALAKHGAILERLGDREPSRIIEAQAIIENIRVEKGYLDEDLLEDLNSLRDGNRKRVERIFELKRRTEAAYTTR